MPFPSLNDRRGVTAVAVVLYALIFVLRLSFSGAGEGLLFFAIVPIALLATEYRVAGGLAGAVIGIALLVTWMVTMDAELGVVGFITRLFTFVLVGVGVGVATRSRSERDARLRDVQEAQHRHESAMKIHDEVIQGLTVAKMALEMDDGDRAVKALDRALESARAVVTGGVVTEVGSFRPPTTPS